MASDSPADGEFRRDTRDHVAGTARLAGYCGCLIISAGEGVAAMAQRLVFTVTDDLDGSDGAETVSFGVDGRDYEIDLAPRNAGRLRDLLQPYLQVARRARPGRAATAPRRVAGRPSGSDPAAVRAWAAAAGITVSPRGRIPASVIEQYQASRTA